MVQNVNKSALLSGEVNKKKKEKKTTKKICFSNMFDMC